MTALNLARRSARALAASLLACTLALAGPALAFAATVTLSANTTVELPSDGSFYTLSSGGTFDQLDISGGTMTFTMSASESVTITAANNRVLNDDGGFTYTCADQSTLTLAPSGSATIVVTPGGTCSASSGGTNGGTGTPTSVSTKKSTSTTTATTTVSATPAVPAAQIEGCAPGNAFNTLTGKSCTISATPATPATPAAGSVTSEAVHVFKANLTTGSLGSEVRALQMFLNAHGYTIVASGPGSPGNETSTFGQKTRLALIKYQKAKGITPASGYFGAKTRAAVNADQ
jgi:hypothetical protein